LSLGYSDKFGFKSTTKFCGRVEQGPNDFLPLYNTKLLFLQYCCNVIVIFIRRNYDAYRAIKLMAFSGALDIRIKKGFLC